MKILITGAAGQLGKEWVHYLKSGNHSVAAYDSSSLDITDSDALHTTLLNEEPDIILNCAAYTNVDGAEKHSSDAYSVNEIGVQNLAHACSRHGVMFVHFSTDYVFEGSNEDQKKLPKGYDEEYPPAPQNVYGKSKRGGELAIEKIADRWMIIRVSWLCGQFGSNFVKTMLKLSGERDHLQVVNDQTGSPTYCFDVVKKTMALIDMNKTGYFHISSTPAITWFDLTKEIIQLTGSKTTLDAVSSSTFPMVAQRPAYSFLKTQKIEQLGLQPINWKKGLKTLLNQLKKSDT